uniref:Myb-like domain-containing protein n=1 Tax=Tanacetum cinerariifolium TaxID=118510 RepID=A0A699HD87_TANCI|nr:hypothetical protein [Tanacetum cinerariifolium]
MIDAILFFYVEYHVLSKILAPPKLDRQAPPQVLLSEMASHTVTKSSLLWTIEEEIALYKACVSESEDSIEGNGKKSSGFWTEVTEHIHKKNGEQKRSYNSVNCKWKDRIRPKVAPMGRDWAKKKASSSVARSKTSIAGDPSLVDALLKRDLELEDQKRPEQGEFERLKIENEIKN